MSERRKIDISKFKKSAKEQRENNNRGSRLINAPEGVEFFSLGSTKDGEDIINKDLNILLYQQTKEPKNESKYDYKRTYYVHSNLGSEGKTSVVCPTTFGQKCPICELYREVTSDWDNMSEHERKQAKMLKKKERTLYNIMDEGKVKLFDFSAFLFQQKLIDELKAEDDETIEAFADDDNGYTIRTRFTKQKKGDMSFYEATKILFKERGEIPTDILEATVKLDDIFVVKSYTELQELLNGESFSAEVEEEEEDTTVAKVSTRRQTTSAEVEETETEDEFEEETARPKPRRAIIEEDEDGDEPW